MASGVLAGGRRFRWALLCAAVGATFLPAAGGAAGNERTRDGDRDAGRPWIRSGELGIFRFDADALPQTPDGFADALVSGCRWAVKLDEAADADVVRVEPGEYPQALESLRINLSDGKFRTRRPGLNASRRHPPAGTIEVGRFELLGHRMRAYGAQLNFDVTARDVRLEHRRTRMGTRLLVMADAREGGVTFEMGLRDVERYLAAKARVAAAELGLDVRRAKLKLTVERGDDGGQAVRLHLRLQTRFLGVPAGLHFRARLHIDPDLNGTLSGLSCTGDDVLGPLLGGLIHPHLRKGEGKTRPLIGFPNARIRLRSLSIESDESIRVRATFGARPEHRPRPESERHAAGTRADP